MRALICFIVLISVAASGAAYLQGEREGIVAYWREKLPTTPIPQSLSELIISADDEGLPKTQNTHSLSPSYDGPDDALFNYNGYVEDESLPKTQKTHSLSPSYNGPDDALFNYNGYVEDDQSLFNYNAYVNAHGHMSMKPSVSLFLLENNLVSGTKVSVNFDDKQKAHFLPRSVADGIPFSSDKLSVALKELNIAPDSVAALAMKQTLQACERPATKGEIKYCPTSLESMIDFTTSELGSNHLNILTTNVPKTSKSGKQEYTIAGVKYESEAQKPAYVCHTVKYAYAVYYCHELEGTKAARVWLKGEDHTPVEAVALCHTDTSAWNSKHEALQMLKVKPGAASVCHFIPQTHLLWLAAS